MRQLHPLAALGIKEMGNDHDFETAQSSQSFAGYDHRRDGLL
jgi:hypothetical protein